MSFSSTKFSISENEILRRKKASLSLVVFLLVGIIVGIFTLGLPLSLELVFMMGICVGVLFILRSLALSTFRLFSQTQIKITADSVWKNDHQVYFTDLTQIFILRTYHGVIREIVLTQKDGRKLILDAVEQFEDCLKQLRLYTKSVSMKECREPIDYDHPLFYVFLGISIGFIVTSGVWILFTLITDVFFAIGAFFAFYLFMLGCYFIFTHPISIRYGKNTRLGEVMCGSFLLAFGILFGIMSIIR